MQSLAIVLALIAVTGITAEALLRKYLLSRPVLFGKKMGFTEREMLVAKCGIAALASFLWLALFGGWWNMLAPVRPDAGIWWAALTLTTAANIFIQFANMRATRLAEVSFVAPISALTPGLVLLTAFLIGEHPGPFGMIGIPLIIAGTYVFVREGSPLREYFTPLFVWLAFMSTEHLPLEERTKRRALRWAYASAACGTVGLMGDGLVARHGDVLLAVALELSVLALSYTFFFPRTARGEGDFATLQMRIRANGGQLFTFGLSFAVPFVMLGIAFRLAPIAEIGSLKRLAIFLTVVGAGWLLKERVTSRRLFLAGIIVVGAVFVALDPTQGVLLDNVDAYIGQFLGR